MKVTRGNSFKTRVPITATTFDGESIDDFALDDVTDLVVVLRTVYSSITTTNYEINDNNLDIDWTGIGLGTYGINISGTYNDGSWRSYVRDVVTIVESDDDAEIDSTIEVEDDCYVLDTVTILTTSEDE